MEETKELSDHVSIMKSGRLLITGTVEKLKEKAGKEKFEDVCGLILTW
jgi:ABC-type Na+ transport system ATPase subunit NatA